MNIIIAALILAAGLGVATSGVYLLAEVTQPSNTINAKRDALLEGFLVGGGAALALFAFLAACRWSTYFAFGV